LLQTGLTSGRRSGVSGSFGLALLAGWAYGVTSYAVSRRREIGIRMALGAAPGSVLLLLVLARGAARRRRSGRAILHPSWQRPSCCWLWRLAGWIPARRAAAGPASVLRQVGTARPQGLAVASAISRLSWSGALRGVLRGHVVVDHHGIADADEIRQDGLLADYGVLLRLRAHADADDSSWCRPRIDSPALVFTVREAPVSAVTVPDALASLGFSAAAALGFAALPRAPTLESRTGRGCSRVHRRLVVFHFHGLSGLQDAATVAGFALGLGCPGLRATGCDPLVVLLMTNFTD
jgi:hypothetical protein